MLLCYPPCNGVFQQDKCTSHMSRLSTGWLYEHPSDFSVINWLLKSPELNHIGVLEQDVKSHHTASTNVFELGTALANIWQVLPVERFQKLVESMPRVWQPFSRPQENQLISS
ncbi:transposable element Tcb2 transposase [Trichonephila clavipes]|nr:transposable element Tcb2 transposase [Trichonephila clavipes]